VRVFLGAKLNSVMNYCLEEGLQECVRLCRSLVVGAGGIGCELVKNLVLAGFKTISLVG